MMMKAVGVVMVRSKAHHGKARQSKRKISLVRRGSIVHSESTAKF